ncbi:MAG: acyltransferase domain-containing protein, partial [Planctomycetales bacterium]|nr:acyltransferase domain-containing protein [Planctomycetales bacterium]
MDRQYVFVLAPTAPLSAKLAIAGCRAGARGVLDLSFEPSGSPSGRRALRELRRHADGFGVLLDMDADQWLEQLGPLAEGSGPSVGSPAGSDGLRTVVLAESVWRDDPQLVAQVKQRGWDLWLQLGTPDLAPRVLELEPQGVLLKGNEAGGLVAAGGETAFVLLQRWRDRVGEDCRLPVVVQGGIGPHTAAACHAGGASGVALDAQLLLTRESPLSGSMRQWLTAADGSETRVIGQELGWPVRFMAPPRCAALEHLQQRADELETRGGTRREWLEAVGVAIEQGALPWGQDAGLASLLIRPHRTVGGVLSSIESQIKQSREAARQHQPLAPGAPLAESHGTEFPLLQGPMTRVSDVAPFADAVAQAGALPFLALALLRGPQVEELLLETKERLEDRPWGVGLLGFLPPEIRKEQMDAVGLHRPPFALIAGGRPDQAQALEQQGIPTYLHVPSPGLLKMFLKDGARRFVFEGRECGGHVGPRSSFVLWENMCQLLLEFLSQPKNRREAEQLHVVFAGGIHDEISATMVATLAAPLAAAGCKVGALMGTAYLYTREAVESGAIVPQFQRQAVETDRTVLLETGPGHAIRCIPTPYYDVFESEKQRLRSEGKTYEEIVKALEWMNIGRLRVASKGVDRIDDGGGRRLAEVSEQEQYDRGMYMIGQVSAMRREVLSMRELHSQVCGGARQRVAAMPADAPATPEASPCDIAIIGMSSFYPGSVGLQQYWENIINKVYAVTEVPKSHWDWELFYDPDPAAPDRIVSKWGGFLEDVVFDPFQYGITPKSIPSIEPLQLLLLESVRLALDDAGYTDRDFDREHTCAILGIGGGGAPLGVMYGLRSSMPLLNTIEGLPTTGEEVIRLAGDQLPEWTEDSFPGFLLNVAVGRTANRFNFGGSNYAIDAACASSLAALHACIRELEMGTANFAVALGADTVNTPYSFMAFSKTHALSARGRCRPFDEHADGIVLSEGIGAVILKRLEDAERDGDDIYAVIRGVGSSSDGKDKGLTAPNAAGQLRALRRAYQKAGISPARVELIEAHGTGTVVGDRTEATSLTMVMQEYGADRQSCALGSVKSMIGHSKCAAGIAGLIKTAKAMHHRTLPPTLVETPNSTADFSNSALYLNTEPRPWIHDPATPRVAGVSAFGFGGTNVHVVLEEYTDGYLDEPEPALRKWPVELLVWRASDSERLKKAVSSSLQKLQAGARPQLNELAASLWRTCPGDASLPTLAIVAESLEDLVVKLESAQAALQKGDEKLSDPRGIFLALSPRGQSTEGSQVAFLFPGQGSQYTDMLSDVALNFHEVRQALDEASGALADAWDRPLGRWIYPPSSFSEQEKQQREQDLASTDVAQPAIGAASLGMLRLLRALGIDADCYAGHSYGEWTALCASGALHSGDLLKLSLDRGQLMRAAASRGSAGGMVAIAAPGARVAELLEPLEEVWLANLNSPQQTVVSGTEQGLDRLEQAAREAKLKTRRLPVACGFHSPLVESAAAPLSDVLRQAPWQTPQAPVYSNVTAAAYPDDLAELQDQLSVHLRSSVRFVEQIEAMYAAGVRTFVEVGPGQVLTGLVDRILHDQPHLAVATDSKSRRGLVQLSHALAQLLTAGVSLDLDPLFDRRHLRTFDVAKLERE